MEPTNEDAAKALERLTNPQAPTPQPKPRSAPAAKPQPTKPQPFKPQPVAKAGAAKAGAAKTTRPTAPAPKAPTKPVKKPEPPPPPLDLQQALAGTRAAVGLRTAPRAKSDPVAFQLALKRTAIPILLTLGFVLIALVIVHYVWKSDDNPVLELPTGIVIGLLAGGVVLWGLALLNMLSVRRTLAARS
jgi:hypothetical protein